MPRLWWGISAGLVMATCACGSNPGLDSHGVALAPQGRVLPIVFVHGLGGSAQQYESQALRFVSNGYPSDHIRVYDHNGAGLDVSEFVPGLG